MYVVLKEKKFKVHECSLQGYDLLNKTNICNIKCNDSKYEDDICLPEFLFEDKERAELFCKNLNKKGDGIK